MKVMVEEEAKRTFIMIFFSTKAKAKIIGKTVSKYSTAKFERPKVVIGFGFRIGQEA
jgi:hypothetical protein